MTSILSLSLSLSLSLACRFTLTPLVEAATGATIDYFSELNSRGRNPDN